MKSTTYQPHSGPKGKWITIAALLATVTSVCAQSSDAIIDKLVEKGILTAKEANELREEADKNFSKAYAGKSGMPNWVTALKFSGDLRLRGEDLKSDNSDFVDRMRFRYRLRFGVNATLLEDFDIGLRLASGDPAPGSGFGGNPLSANTTLQDNATRKFIYVDAAFARWTPIHNGDWTVSGIIGKMDDPFQISSMVFDYDYNPEGAAIQLSHKFNSRQELRFNAGIFVLDELSASTRDPYMMGAQLLWNAKWTSRFETSLGASVFTLGNATNLLSANVPDQNNGNTRNGFGALVYSYNPVVASASTTYSLERFPLYKNAFPIKLAGEYMKNPAAPGDNYGAWGGITFGKAGAKGLWQVAYRYQWLGGDAWYEEVVDDDNIAYYQAASALGSAGMHGGTNIKGHWVRLDWSLTDALTFTFTCYLNELINPSPAGSKNSGTRLMADLMWKF